MKDYKVVLQKVRPPERDCPLQQPELTDETILERKQKLLCAMRAHGWDQLIVYGDIEHGSNFEYLVGFLPRFEEALLLLDGDGACTLVLGNENLNKGTKARVPAMIVHAPQFSLPNQPCGEKLPLAEILRQAGVRQNAVIGLAGWKLFTNPNEDTEQMSDVPGYILQALQKAGVKPLCQCNGNFYWGKRRKNHQQCQRGGTLRIRGCLGIGLCTGRDGSCGTRCAGMEAGRGIAATRPAYQYCYHCGQRPALYKR